MMATDRDALDKLATISRLDVVHKITHFLYMPTVERAREAMLALLAREFEVVEPYYLLDAWSVLVRTEMVPDEEAIVALRDLFTEIAEEHEGEYDGWEAAVPKISQQASAGEE
jgi:hypothetical protein